MASSENLRGAKPAPRAEPSAADEDTEGHAWMNDNETVVVDDDTEGHRLASNDDETVVEDDRD
jgi:hypothetical protein